METLAKPLSGCVAETLTYHAETLNLLPDKNFGGRAGRSTADTLHLTVKFIKDQWRKGNVVSALFLDVRGAFSSVAVEWLTHNMRQKGVPPEYTNWVTNRLQNRQTRIQFNDFTSELLNIDNGCNQGDPISVILYHFYNAALIEVAKKDKGELAPAFIDDVTYLAAGPTFKRTHTKIAHMMNWKGGANEWSKEHKSTFELDKMKLIDFTRKREWDPNRSSKTRPVTRKALTLGGITIAPVPPLHHTSYSG
jgi:Reverse transcriptase (RNA-dependent DNA polymerase)